MGRERGEGRELPAAVELIDPAAQRHVAGTSPLEQAVELLAVAVAEAPLGRLESVNGLRVNSNRQNIL